METLIGFRMNTRTGSINRMWYGWVAVQLVNNVPVAYCPTFKEV